MVKRTQTIRRQNPTDRVNVFDYFVWLALKGLTLSCLMLKHGQTYFENFTVLIPQDFCMFGNFSILYLKLLTITCFSVSC